MVFIEKGNDIFVTPIHVQKNACKIHTKAKNIRKRCPDEPNDTRDIINGFCLEQSFSNHLPTMGPITLITSVGGSVKFSVNETQMCSEPLTVVRSHVPSHRVEGFGNTVIQNVARWNAIKNYTHMTVT